MSEYIYPGVFREEVDKPLLKDIWGKFYDIETIPSFDSDRSLTSINGKTYNKFVVDVGGGPLLSALGHLQQPGTGVMVIDPVMGSRTHGPSYQPLAEAIIKRDYQSIPAILRDLSSDYSRQELSLTDQDLVTLYAQRAQNIENFDDLFLINNAVQSFEFDHSSYSDHVTCYYPRPNEEQASGIIQGCMALLKKGSQLELVTEDHVYWKYAQDAAFKLGFRCGIRTVPPRKPRGRL